MTHRVGGHHGTHYLRCQDNDLHNKLVFHITIQFSTVDHGVLNSTLFIKDPIGCFQHKVSALQSKDKSEVHTWGSFLEQAVVSVVVQSCPTLCIYY